MLRYGVQHGWHGVGTLADALSFVAAAGLHMV